MIDLPELQSQLISLLTSIESQRQTDSATSLEAMTLEATLNLAHSGKPHILVNDIANEVNRITRARRTASLQRRDDRAQHKRGHLLTRQLGKAAKGLGMDLATMACVHEFELVWVYE